MKKYIFIILTLVSLISANIIPTFASTPETIVSTEIIQTDIGDIEVETVLSVYDSPLRNNTKSADKTQTFKQNGSVIAKVTLSSTFGYNGTYAWVISSDSSHTTYDGWAYGDENFSVNSNTVTLSGLLTKTLQRDIIVEIKMTCSPSGTIS